MSPGPRRILLFLVLAAAVGGALALSLGRFGGPPKRPNVILFVWDTCRADRLSAYGYPRPTSPRLERFARDGVLFRRAYAPAPWTPPSHASLFTGLLPSRHGLTQGSGVHARVRRGIPLLAETLRDAGYDTVGFSCNGSVSVVTGLDAGFRPMTAVYSGDEIKGSGEKAFRAIAAWLAARKATTAADARPVFLFVNLMEAHIPRLPQAKALAPVRDPAVGDADLDRARALVERDVFLHTLGLRRVDDRTVAAARTLYDASCRQLDAETGEILDLLEAGGLLDGALVAITADHGEALGEHGEMGHRMSVYDTLLHVPLVVRWPGHLDGGRAEDRQVRLQDLYPTILEAARVPVPPGNGVDAASLVGDAPAGRTVLSEFHRPQLSSSEIRSMFPDAPEATLDRFRFSYFAAQEPWGSPGARKMVRVERQADTGAVAVEHEEMYDLAADPAEARDLLASPGAEDRAAAQRLRAALEKK